MMARTHGSLSRWLVRYGLFLVSVAIVAVMYASTLITGMWLAAVVLLAMLVRNRAARAPVEPIEIQNQPVN